MAETDLWFGTLSATVRVEDLPASRQVVAIERQANGDWRVCGQAVSNAEGIATLPITGLPTSRIYAIAIDEWGKPFAPGMPVAYGDVIRPTQFLGWMYQVTSPGVLPGEEPEWWNSMAGIPQPVGTAMMQAVRHYQPIAHGPVSDIEWEEKEFDPHWDKVVSLMHFDGDLVDETGENTFYFNGLSSYSGGLFGQGINPSGNYSKIVKSDGQWQFLDGGPVTVELFFKATGTPALPAPIFISSNNLHSSNSAFRRLALYQMVDNTIGIEYGTTSDVVEITTPLSYTEFQHLAFTLDSGILKVFQDGVMVYEGSYPVIPVAFVEITLGGMRSSIVNNAAQRTVLGVIDELRITKGVARYTEDFTPPTEPFPNVGPPL